MLKRKLPKNDSAKTKRKFLNFSRISCNNSQVKSNKHPATLQKRLLFSFLVITLFLSGCISVCSYIITYHVLRERISSSFRFTLDYVANSIKIEKDRIEYLTNYIFVNEDIKKAILKGNEHTVESVELDYEAYSSLKHYFISHNLLDICSISIIGENGYHLFYYSNLDEQELQCLPEIVKESKEILKASNGAVVWGGVKPKFYGDGKIQANEIRLYRIIKNERFTEDIGFMFISIKPHLFSKLVQIYDSAYPDFARETGVFVIQNNSVLVQSETIDVDEDVVLSVIGNTEAYSSNGYPVPGSDYISFTKDIDDTPWKIIGLIPEKLIHVDHRYILLISIVAFFLCIIVCSLVWLYISSTIFLPLKKLSDTIKKIEKGDKELRAEVIYNDEIGILSSNFNTMLDRNEELYRTTLQKEIEIKETQYQMLQAQINPHFLYNTLSSIRWMAIMIKAENIKTAIDAFWSISKYNFSTQQKYIPINDEVEIVKRYLYLQQIAYKNVFDVEWDIDEDVYNFRCIKFFLQPILENSIKHGILEKKELGLIKINIYRSCGFIHFFIRDNGAGMSHEKKSEILSSGKKPSGLSNVIYRLELAYGSHYKMDILSEKGEYTEMNISIPEEGFNAESTDS